MSVTKFKQTASRTGNGLIASGQTVDRGDILAFNTSGKIQVINDTAGFTFAGIANNAAGDTGELSTVEYEYGKPYFYAAAGAAQVDVGEAAYASGLGTIAKSSSNAVFCGVICDVEVGVGWWIDPMYPQNLGTTAGTDDWSRDAANTRVFPINAGDKVASGDPTAIAKALDLNTNIVQALGTDTNIPVVVKPKGTGAAEVYGGLVNAQGAGADVDLVLSGKGTGVVKAVVTDGTLAVLAPFEAKQATTGTVGTAGEIAVAGMTASGVVIATIAEDPGSNLALSDVVCATGKFTVYTRNTNTDARAALSGKKVNYIVVSL